MKYFLKLMLLAAGWIVFEALIPNDAVQCRAKGGDFLLPVGCIKLVLVS